MKVGIGSYAFRWSIGIGDYRPEAPMGPVELLHTAAGIGAEVLQFADNLPLDTVSDAVISDLRQASLETGVEVQLGTNSLDAAHLERQRALADVLKAPVIRIAPGAADMADDATLVQRLRDEGDAFAKVGCLITLENHFRLAPADLADLVTRVAHDNVRVCLDVANSVANREWPETTIRTLAPHAGNLHIKDYDIALDPYGVGMHIVGVPLGEGLMDVDFVLAELAACGRDVDAIVEHWLPKDRFSTHEEARRLELEWSSRSIAAFSATVAAARDEGSFGKTEVPA